MNDQELCKAKVEKEIAEVGAFFAWLDGSRAHLNCLHALLGVIEKHEPDREGLCKGCSYHPPLDVHKWVLVKFPCRTITDIKKELNIQ